jgi:hypothetical protein
MNPRKNVNNPKTTKRHLPSDFCLAMQIPMLAMRRRAKEKKTRRTTSFF